MTRQEFEGTLGTVAERKSDIDPRTVAENIIRDHGKAAFVKLISLLREGESGTKIGYILGVSRQRINQWKQALGDEQVTYNVHPSVESLLPKRATKGTRRTAV